MNNNEAIGSSPGAAAEKPNQFPWKLYDMLDMAEKRNEEHIISWIRDGKAFKVHDRNLFIEEYMKKMFNQTKFKSFQRQLNLWGFERVQGGPDKGSYFHPLFVRGRRDFCQRLTRVRLKGSSLASPSGVEEKVDSQYSPQSVATPESLSTAGVATFPLSVPLPTASGSGNLSAASPTTPSLSSAIEIPRPDSTGLVFGGFRGALHPTQLSDFLQCHTDQHRREMIRNAAMGLSPDFSMTLVGSPLFVTATDTSQRRFGEEDEDRGHEGHRQDHQKSDEVRTMQPQIELSIHERQQQEQTRLMEEQRRRQQQIEEQTRLEHQARIEPHEQQPPTRTTSRGMEALLSVSAQRRQEEELALLLGLSDHGETAQTR